MKEIKIKRVLGWTAIVILFIALHMACFNSTSGGAIPPSAIPLLLDFAIVMTLIIGFFYWAFDMDKNKQDESK